MTLSRLALALIAVALSAPAHAAPTFPTDCATFPADCAGAALTSRYSTNGLADHPQLYNPAIHPPEVQMFRVTMNLMSYPDARCNDGSPAVFYFGPAPMGSQNADKWVIQLEGGGGCLDAVDEDGLHQDCMDRWTGRGTALLDFPRKMSTDLDDNGVTDVNFLPFEGRIPGLFGVDTVVTDPNKNGGADAWNRIYINYCSSDLWMGQSGSQPLDDGEWIDPFGNPQVYEPVNNGFFHGHLILDSVLDAVLAGVVSDDGERQFRLTSAPEQLLLVGESAGGGGVNANLDFLAGKAGWGANFAGVDRGITMGVSGATTQTQLAYDDAAIAWYTGPVTVQEWDMSLAPPALVDVDLDGNGTIDTHAQEAGPPLRRPNYENIIHAFVDQSCLAANTDPFAPDPNQRHWLCYRSAPLYEDGHITTPILVKMDLADPLVGSGVPAFDDGVRATMDNLPANFEYFGPQCSHHESLSNGSYFRRDRVNDPVAGRSVNYHRAIAEFVNGIYTSIYFEPGVTTRNCAP